MSKQSEVKVAQNYRLVPDTCGNCQHYQSQIVEKVYENWGGRQVWTEEKGKRCTLGGFMVNKTAVCDFHERVVNA